MYKNTASQKLTVFAFDATTNLPKTGDAANLTAYVDKDDGGVTVLADTSATEKDSTNAKGYYIFDVAQAETNADKLLFSCKSATANIVVVCVPAVVYTRPPNFSALSITAGGVAKSDLDTIKTQTVTCAAGVTVSANVGTAAAAGASGGPIINGSNTGTVTLAALTCTGALTISGGMVITQSSSNTVGLSITGNGTAAGVSITGGATGAGVKFIGGGTSGAALSLTTTSGDGVSIAPTAGHGINVAANGASKHGVTITGGTSGTSHGVNFVAGSGGFAIKTGGFSVTSTSYIAASEALVGALNISNAAGHGVYVSGAGTGSVGMLLLSSGDSGQGLGIQGTGSDGSGLYLFGEYPFYAETAGANQDVITLLASGTGKAIAATGPSTLNAITGSLSGAVGSVTGAVGSVTGAVGSVTGNVGGNVVGSVASVTAGVTVTTNNDKTGYGLSAAAVQAVWDALTSALITSGSIGKKLLDLFSGMTSLPQWLGLIAGKQTGNTTARTEIRATGAGSGTFDETTDSQEAIRDNQSAGSGLTAQQTRDAMKLSPTAGAADAGSIDDLLAGLTPGSPIDQSMEIEETDMEIDD